MGVKKCSHTLREKYWLRASKNRAERKISGHKTEEVSSNPKNVWNNWKLRWKTANKYALVLPHLPNNLPSAVRISKQNELTVDKSQNCSPTCLMCTVHCEGAYSVLSHTVHIKQLTTGTQSTLGSNMFINRRQRTDIGKYSFVNRTTWLWNRYLQKSEGLSPVNQMILEGGLGKWLMWWTEENVCWKWFKV